MINDELYEVYVVMRNETLFARQTVVMLLTFFPPGSNMCKEEEGSLACEKGKESTTPKELGPHQFLQQLQILVSHLVSLDFQASSIYHILRAR